MSGPPSPDATQLVQAYDASGNVVSVPASEAAGLVRSGQIQLGEQSEIGVEGADGKLVSLKGQAAVDYLTSSRALIEGAQGGGAVTEQQKREEWDSIGGVAKGAALGALDTSTLGLGTAAGAYLSPEFAQTVKEAERYAPGSYMAGQGLGLIPALVAVAGTGGGAAAAAGGAEAAAAGGSLLARGAAGAARLMPSALAAGAGQAAERAAGRLLVGAGLEGSGVLATGARVAAGQAVEQALYGAGDAVRTAALDNVDLTAERVLAGAGWGALSGAALGGALGAGGAILSKGASKAADAMGALRASVATKELETAARLEGSLAKQETTVRALTDDFAREQAFKAIGASSGQVRRLEQEYSRELVDRMLAISMDVAPSKAGIAEGKLLTGQARKEAVESFAKAVGEERGALIKDLEKSGGKVNGESFAEVEQRARARMAIEDTKLNDKQRRFLEEKLHDAAVYVEDGTPSRLWEFRRLIDEQAGRASITDFEKSVLLDIKRGIDDGLVKAADDAGLSAWKVRWAETGKDYTAAQMALPILESKAAKSATQGYFGLQETIAAGAAIAGGGLAGVPAAILGSVASQFYKRHGAELGYQIARASSRGEVAAQIAKIAEANVSRSFAGLIGDLASKGGRVAAKAPQIVERVAAGAPVLAREVSRVKTAEQKTAKSRREEYARAEAEVRAWQKNGRGAPGARDLFDGAQPDLLKSIEARVEAAGRALERALPKGSPPPGATVQGHVGSGPKPTEAEMQRFLDVKKIIDEPGYVAQLAREGRLTPEHVATWREVQPLEYERVRAHAVAALAELKEPLPYRQALQLSTMLDIPADASTTPEFVTFAQGLYPKGAEASGPQGGGASPQPSSLKPPSGGTLKTSVSFSQRLTGG